MESYTPIRLDIALLRKHIADEKLVRFFSGIKFKGELIDIKKIKVTDEAVTLIVPDGNGGFTESLLLENDFFENDQSLFLFNISEKYREIDNEIDDFIESINK